VVVFQGMKLRGFNNRLEYQQHLLEAWYGYFND